MSDIIIRKTFNMVFNIKSSNRNTEDIFISEANLSYDEKKSLISNLEIPKLEVNDDYGENIEIKNRLGTTLVNFLNKSDSLLEILNKYLKIINKYDVTELFRVKEKMLNILPLVSEQVLDNVFSVSTDYEYVELKYKNKDDSSKMIEEMRFLLKNEEVDLNSQEFKQAIKILLELDSINLGDLDLEEKVNMFDMLYNKCTNVVECILKYKMEQKIKALEVEMKQNVNDILKELLTVIFRLFYDDYNYLDVENLNNFRSKCSRNHKNNPYNYYYAGIFEYITKVYNASIEQIKAYKKMPIQTIPKPKQYNNFSYKDISLVFIEQLINEITFIKDNFQNQKLKYIYQPQYTEIIKNNTKSYIYEIKSLTELFYISKYYIEKFSSRNKILKCKMCGKYFLPKTRNSELNCDRIFINNKTCKEYAQNIYTKIDTKGNKIYLITNKIRTLLKKRGSAEANKLLKDFNEQLNKNKDKMSKEELLVWLDNFHNKIIKDYKKMLRKRSNNI